MSETLQENMTTETSNTRTPSLIERLTEDLSQQVDHLITLYQQAIAENEQLKKELSAANQKLISTDDNRHDSENQLASLLGRIGVVLEESETTTDVKSEVNHEIQFMN